MADVTRLLDRKATIAQMRERRRIVEWLRKVADHIDRGEAETDPFCAVLTLIGRKQSEVLALGMAEENEIAEAATTLFRHAISPSGEQNHSIYPRNFVQFLRDWQSAEMLINAMKNK
ncbi:hypothetical protein HA052_19755 [Chromobacterium haemolyticum]|uniref:Uncharacterized protein n=1 Tax=Chromobacterium fluminis TaxID=3044269 RepID=A0ABX0L9G8_9NEIS|nr:hypothetical protein [Chromobacterium haemolyticum]NHR07430.1 hypothetical protein [Chromobacterium haemolyticum]